METIQLLHSVTKTKAAFLMSANKLFENSPAVYFWTFTFVEVLHDFQAAMQWAYFRKDLCNKFGGCLRGLRVVEVHPAEYSHGLHYHCLVNMRLNIHVVKQIGKRHGIGFSWVSKATPETKFYLAKYMTKETDLSDGMRKWGAIGGFKTVKVRDIEVDSIFSRNMKWCQEKLTIKQMSYAFFLHVSNNTQRYGAIEEWPIEKVNTVNMRNAKADHMKDIKPCVLQPPDDDGVTYYDLHPMKTRFENCDKVWINGEYGWTEVLVPHYSKNDPDWSIGRENENEAN